MVSVEVEGEMGGLDGRFPTPAIHGFGVPGTRWTENTVDTSLGGWARGQDCCVRVTRSFCF
jgi:hypothetical protein